MSCTSYQECGFYLMKVRDLEWVAMTAEEVEIGGKTTYYLDRN